MAANSASSQLHRYRSLFGDRLQENVTLANYTTARVGGGGRLINRPYHR